MNDDEIIPPPRSDALRASERAVLGAVIQSARLAEETALTLRPEHFREPAHYLVFAAVLRLADNGDPVDPASVLTELTRSGEINRVGADGDAGTGGVYLHTLMAASASAASLPWHAERVRDGWRQRRLTEAVQTCWQIARDPGFDPDVHFDQVRKLIEDATAEPGVSALPTQAEVMAGVLGDLESNVSPGLPTGIADLDQVLGGLHPGQVIVIGARTSVGKSVLGLTFAEHVSGKLGLPVLLSSLEMSTEEIAHRRIADAAGIPLDRLARHELGDTDWEAISRAQARLMESALLVDDKPGVSLAHIRGRLRGMERAGAPARLLIIDYLGLLADPKAESRQAGIAQLTQGAKNIARELAIPVVLIVQVNRAPEARSDRRPALSDLRESGAIENDADVVLLLHREDYYDAESPRAGEIDVIVAKQRQGIRTTVPLSFQGHYCRIADLERRWTPSSAIGGAA